MIKIGRQDIQIISRHSNLSEKGIDKLLKEHVYSDKESWQKFLKLLSISLGVGFLTAGIVFFFAYNWADLHKFAKIGIIETLIVVTTLIAAFSRSNRVLKNTILTAASILVGVLYAVFGQIYQTGADAYDFFLGWTISIFLWVAISNFAPLWLVFITLINTTFILYFQQVAHEIPENFVITLLLIINVLFLVASFMSHKFIDQAKTPKWFSNILALACVSLSTIGISIGIFDQKETPFFILITITLILYFIGIKYGLKHKSIFYLSIISLSVIIMIAAFLTHLSDGASMFLFISLFVVASVTLVIKNLIDLQKKWIN